MKILFVTTVSSTIGFLVPHMRYLIEKGNRVDVACNILDIDSIELQEIGLHVHDICFQRAPLSRENLRAYKMIRKLAMREMYDVMHVHTPVAAFLARMACRNIPHLKVCYTAHGFHFYKGAPLLNWAVYYTLEKLAAGWTDILITMNREDYTCAKKLKLRDRGATYFVNGVGLDVGAILRAQVDIIKKREELGIPANAYMLLSVGELVRNKNLKTSIRAFAKINIPGCVYLICGCGPDKDGLKKIAQKLKVSDRVVFAGFRHDIYEILKAADVFLFPSLREGLPVSVMEAMTAGLPVVCSGIRGNTDLIRHEMNGFVVKKEHIAGFAEAVERLHGSAELGKKFEDANKEIVCKYSIENVMRQMEAIYSAVW